METKDTSFALNLENIKRINFDKYDKGFAFIVNGKRYETSRFVADIISPKIMKYHYNDESVNEYSMKVSKGEYFSEFLELANFESNHLDENRLKICSEYFLKLGNIDEYFRLRNNIFEELSTSNVVNEILKIKETIDDKENFLSICSNLKKNFDFCSENFIDIPKEELFKLDPSMIEEIIKSDRLKLDDEDKLLEILIEMYERDNTNSFLFEYVYFNQVGDEALSKFIDIFDVENMNNGIWKSICSLIKKSTKKRQSSSNSNQDKKKKNKEEIIEIQYKQGQDFNGLMRYLVDKTGGNIHDNGTVEITANSIYGNIIKYYHPKYLVENSGQYQANGSSIVLLFDFKEKQVQLTSYTIETDGCRHLRNWIIECSNDSNNWYKIDEHSNDNSLNSNNKIVSFDINSTHSFSRYVRLRETGLNSDNDYYTYFSKLEFYGKMKQPQ